jgi:putative hemin transport protein
LRHRVFSPTPSDGFSAAIAVSEMPPPNFPTVLLMKTTTDLQTAWTELRQAEPKIRIRDAAARLGVSEAELLVTGSHVTRLRPDWAELFDAFKTLGRVMCLTRNEHAVHERKGIFREIGFFGGGAMGQVVGHDIDLRLFPNSWTAVFGVQADAETGASDSIQIFGADGMAMHKVFLQEDSDRTAFEKLLTEFRAEGQGFVALPAEALATDRPDAEIDVEGFRSGWRSLEDTHHFFGLLKKHQVGRVQALRLAGEEFAQPLPTTVAGDILRQAAAAKLPIMIFVGNRGCIQIHTGEVEKIVPYGEWINVLDPDFNLHLRESGVVSAWLVRKPTKDGVVTSVELYDAAGENVALIFGKRKPGEPEDTNWRSLAEGLK